jgi:hypothetical protein
MVKRKHSVGVKGSRRTGPVSKAAGTMIRVVLCEAGARAREHRIQNTPQAIADAVGGSPARFWTFFGAWAFFNKKAVDLHLPWNLIWADRDGDCIYAGNLLFVGATEAYGEVCGLTRSRSNDIIYSLNKLMRKLPPTPSSRDEQLMWLGLDPDFLP